MDPLRRRAAWELVGVALTAAGHFVFQSWLALSGPYVFAASGAWIAYVVVRLRAPGQARAWGIRRDTLRAALAVNAFVAIVAGAAMIAYGVSRGRGAPAPTFWILLAVYPIWGFVQQLLVCAIGYGSLRALLGRPLYAWAVATALFGLVHAPDWQLWALTTSACAVWLPIYQRWPNLWAQGLAHGVLAAIAYHFVLARDPWSKIVASFGAS